MSWSCRLCREHSVFFVMCTGPTGYTSCRSAQRRVCWRSERCSPNFGVEPQNWNFGTWI